MNHLGNIIQQYREKLNLTRKELSRNICTEKYIYLIERGERSPSSFMTKQLNDKLGVDLFEYYEYLDCEDPVNTLQIIKKFEEYRRMGDFVALYALSESVKRLPDFNKDPWQYEIQINEISHDIFVKRQYGEAIENIECLIKEAEEKNIEGVFLAKLCVALSTCLQILGRYEEAGPPVLKARQCLLNKHEMAGAEEHVIMVNINYMTCLYYARQYDSAIEESLKLIEFMRKRNRFEMIYSPYFFGAFSYFLSGKTKKALASFKLGLYAALITNRETEMYYFISMDPFRSLLHDPYISQDLVIDIVKKYKLEL